MMNIEGEILQRKILSRDRRHLSQLNHIVEPLTNASYVHDQRVLQDDGGLCMPSSSKPKEGDVQILEGPLCKENQHVDGSMEVVPTTSCM